MIFPETRQKMLSNAVSFVPIVLLSPELFVSQEAKKVRLSRRFVIILGPSSYLDSGAGIMQELKIFKMVQKYILKWLQESKKNFVAKFQHIL